MWIIISSITTIVSALMAESNRILALSGIRLNFYRTIIASIFTFPIALFYQWPSDLFFYLIAIFLGANSALGAIVLFYLSAKHNGRVGLLSGPPTVFLTFFVWLFLDLEEWQRFIQEPVRSGFIIFFMVIALLSIFTMRRNKDSLRVLAIVIPVSVIQVVGTVLSKIVLDDSSNLFGSVAVFSFIIMISQVFFSGLVLKIRKEHLEIGRIFGSFAKGTIIMAILGTAGCYLSWLAIALAPNPAYAKAFFMLSAPLIMAYHRFKGIADDVNPIAGLILVLSSIGLILTVI